MFQPVFSSTRHTRVTEYAYKSKKDSLVPGQTFNINDDWMIKTNFTENPAISDFNYIFQWKMSFFWNVAFTK